MIDLSLLCEGTLKLIGHVHSTDLHLSCIARWLSMDDLGKGDALTSLSKHPNFFKMAHISLQDSL